MSKQDLTFIGTISENGRSLKFTKKDSVFTNSLGKQYKESEGYYFVNALKGYTIVHGITAVTTKFHGIENTLDFIENSKGYDGGNIYLKWNSKNWQEMKLEYYDIELNDYFQAIV